MGMAFIYATEETQELFKNVKKLVIVSDHLGLTKLKPPFGINQEVPLMHTLVIET